MPVGGQEALIVSPRGVQVGPGAVGGVITPRSLVQHEDGQDEEEEEETREGGGQGKMGDGNRRWERKVGGGSQRGMKWRSKWEESRRKRKRVEKYMRTT